jgi:hypothetical protein
MRLQRQIHLFIACTHSFPDEDTILRKLRSSCQAIVARIPRVPLQVSRQQAAMTTTTEKLIHSNGNNSSGGYLSNQQYNHSTLTQNQGLLVTLPSQNAFSPCTAATTAQADGALSLEDHIGEHQA